MSAGASGAAQPAAVVRPSDDEDEARERKARRSPLAQLLHALNQPLTGLQCSLEVTLAATRTNEHYVKTLREGLALTERMRMLVEALREVVETGETGGGAMPGIDERELCAALQEAVEELRPVAGQKNVQISPHTPQGLSASAHSPQTGGPGGVFLLVESALALAAPGTVMRIHAGSAGNYVFRVQWETEKVEAALSRPELGLLVAQAQLEQRGLEWERRKDGRSEVVTIRWPCGASSAGRSA